MYYRLAIRINDNYSYIDSTDLSENETSSLIEGITLERNFVEVNEKYSHFPRPDIMGESVVKLFVSNKVKEIISRFEKDNNYKFISASTNNTLWLLNLLNNVRAFDWDKSTYTTIGKKNALHKITHLAFNEEMLEGRHIFRLYEKPIALFISQELKQAFEVEGVTGIVISDNMDLSVGI